MNLRKAIGAIILDINDNIITFQRSDFNNTWQEPEGGIDIDETPSEALYRELWEEINLNKDDFTILKETKNFIPYLFSKNNKKKFNFDGQEKKFFLIKLKSDKINFKYNNTDEVEFISHKITTPKELLESVPYFKKNMYKKVLNEFNLFI